MILILTVDNRNGMSFNNRRQRKSHVLQENIFEMIQGSKLYMNSEASQQFPEETRKYEQISIYEDIKDVGAGEYCFIETWTDRLFECEEKIEKIVVYRWSDRVYAADVIFDSKLSDYGWEKSSVCRRISEDSEIVISRTIWIRSQQGAHKSLREAVRPIDKKEQLFEIRNGNKPEFDEDSRKDKEGSHYKWIECNGYRKQVAEAVLLKENVHTEEPRKSAPGRRSKEKPKGFESCHLIAFQLLPKDDKKRENRVAGTNHFNRKAMYPFENMVRAYLCETGDPVLYRVSAIFEGDNKIASGVQMEAKSDSGEFFSMCIAPTLNRDI